MDAGTRLVRTLFCCRFQLRIFQYWIRSNIKGFRTGKHSLCQFKCLQVFTATGEDYQLTSCSAAQCNPQLAPAPSGLARTPPVEQQRPTAYSYDAICKGTPYGQDGVIVKTSRQPLYASPFTRPHDSQTCHLPCCHWRTPATRGTGPGSPS